MAILKDKSKKKKGENIIGKIIYGFLLFAPILSILTTCLYVVFNKNAYQSYYGETINEENNIALTNLNELQSGKTYTFTSNNTNTSNSTAKRIYFNNLQILGTNINQTNINTLLTCNSFTTTYYGTSAYLVAFDNLNEYTICDMSSSAIVFTFVLDYETHPTNYTYNQLWDNFLTYKEHNKYSYLDNAFDYGMYKTEQNNIYNWAKNTGTYTVLQTTTNQIGITNTFVPMLMAYWLLISVIYFIFDIALILIWAVHDKIHELKDAI